MAAKDTYDVLGALLHRDPDQQKTWAAHARRERSDDTLAVLAALAHCETIIRDWEARRSVMIAYAREGLPEPVARSRIGDVLEKSEAWVRRTGYSPKHLSRMQELLRPVLPPNINAVIVGTDTQQRPLPLAVPPGGPVGLLITGGTQADRVEAVEIVSAAATTAGLSADNDSQHVLHVGKPADWATVVEIRDSAMNEERQCLMIVTVRPNDPPPTPEIRRAMRWRMWIGDTGSRNRIAAQWLGCPEGVLATLARWGNTPGDALLRDMAAGSGTPPIPFELPV